MRQRLLLGCVWLWSWESFPVHVVLLSVFPKINHIDCHSRHIEIWRKSVGDINDGSVPANKYNAALQIVSDSCAKRVWSSDSLHIIFFLQRFLASFFTSLLCFGVVFFPAWQLCFHQPCFQQQAAVFSGKAHCTLSAQQQTAGDWLVNAVEHWAAKEPDNRAKIEGMCCTYKWVIMFLCVCWMLHIKHDS